MLRPSSNVSSVPLAAVEQEAPVFPALASFVGELKRRRVYRAAVTYAAAAFVVVQGADLILPALLVPAWMNTALIVAKLVGFPVMLVLPGFSISIAVG